MVDALNYMSQLFQFHKVQLTLLGVEEKLKKIKFQFHKVQLTHAQGGKTVLQSKFQFHKVQLTQHTLVTSSITYYVSIP